MGDWGGAPEGWVPPEERAEMEAAAEAAAKFEERRAQQDAQTSAITSAIMGGFATLADAILVAAGVSPEGREQFFAGIDATDTAPDCGLMTPADAHVFVGGPPIAHDDGINDILDDGDADSPCTCVRGYDSGCPHHGRDA